MAVTNVNLIRDEFACNLVHENVKRFSLLNNIQMSSSYLIGNKIHLHYKKKNHVKHTVPLSG
jgi:hypothetical protein